MATENPIEGLPRLQRTDQLIHWARQLIDDLDKRWYSLRNPLVRRVAASDKTIASDYIIMAVNGGSNIVLTLQADTPGHQIIVIKEDAGVGTVTIKTTASGDIVIPGTLGKVASVIYDGADWDLLYKT